jgi:hypothetical protein
MRETTDKARGSDHVWFDRCSSRTSCRSTASSRAPSRATRRRAWPLAIFTEATVVATSMAAIRANTITRRLRRLSRSGPRMGKGLQLPTTLRHRLLGAMAPNGKGEADLTGEKVVPQSTPESGIALALQPPVDRDPRCRHRRIRKPEDVEVHRLCSFRTHRTRVERLYDRTRARSYPITTPVPAPARAPGFSARGGIPLSSNASVTQQRANLVKGR